MTPPFVENREAFLPTTPLTEDESSRLYKTRKRRVGRVLDYADSVVNQLDAGAEKQLKQSAILKRNKELGNPSPVELALGGAGVPSKEAVNEAKGYASDALKFAVGDTPAEWATGALMGPGKLPVKLARAAALASLHTPEAEGVLLNLGAKAPSRWDVMLRQAERLKAQGGTAEDLFKLTGGKMTIGPAGEFEGIYRPRAYDLSNLTRTKRALSDVWKDPHLYDEVPKMRDASIRRALPGELQPSIYGQYNPRENLILVNPNVKNSDYVRGTIGHETGHALSEAVGDLSRLGTGGSYKAKQLDEGLQDLQKHLPKLVDPDERARHAALAWRLRMAKGREPKDLYFRDIGEAHGRASESAIRIPGLEPYSNPIVTKRFGLQRPTYDDNEFARLMNPGSVVESGDLTSIIRKLKQTVGAP